jgi:hypothetical protein
MIHAVKSLSKVQKIPPACIFWLIDLNTHPLPPSPPLILEGLVALMPLHQFMDPVFIHSCMLSPV